MITSSARKLMVLTVCFALAAGAAQPIEELLPKTALFYAGVNQFESGYQKVANLVATNLPFTAEFFNNDAWMMMLARELDMEGVTDRESFVRQSGLDRTGRAAIAYVPIDSSWPFHRRPNENFLFIAPVKNADQAEALLGKKILPQFARQSYSICSGIGSRIREAQRNWRRQEEARANAELSWQQLLASCPSLDNLSCPDGGEYTLTAGNNAPTCSVHGNGNHRDTTVTDFSRTGLGVRKIGNLTVVGGVGKGVGYIVTDSHIAFSNNVLVIEACARAAADKQQRAQLKPVSMAGSDGQIFLSLNTFSSPLQRELARARSRKGDHPSLQRLQQLLDGAGAVSADVRLGKMIELALDLAPVRNPVTAEVLDTAPAELTALTMIPDSALVAVGTNLAPQVFSTITDMVNVGQPRMAPMLRMIQLACDGDGAFAITPGSFAGEMPNMLLVLKQRAPDLGAAAIDTWKNLLMMQNGNRAQLETRQKNGLTISSITVAKREHSSLHWTVLNEYVIVATDAAQMDTVIEIAQGNKSKSLLASAKYRQLGEEKNLATTSAYMDMAAVIQQIAENNLQQNMARMNRYCRANMERINKAVVDFKLEKGRLPNNLAELRKVGRENNGKNGWHVNDDCRWGKDRYQLIIDPNTGNAQCPIHGTAVDFRPGDMMSRRPREEELVFSAFGRWALQLSIKDDHIVGRGKLLPVPQRR